MTDDGPRAKLEELERENRALKKRLARTEGKLQSLEILQGQNANLLRALMTDLDDERAESEKLLLNILPAPIAERLKADSGVIADRFDSVSVLFSDIVGFTPLAESLSPEEMVAWLNDVYSEFDSLVQRHGVEKIRTIGDGYMAAAGVPFEKEGHARALVTLALDMKAHFETLPTIHGQEADFRIGISSGSVVGGVIGTYKFQYDIWGDTVNTASRMESQGVPGRIHISAATHQLIRGDFRCVPREPIEVKGKGMMNTWFVEGPVGS